MAYARRGFDSDVWMYHTGTELFCHGPDDETFFTVDPKRMLEHLRGLEVKGFMTGGAIDRLASEMAAGEWR